RDHGVVLALLLAASAAASGFVVGRHHPARRATDIPTRVEAVDAMADEVGLDEAQRAQVIAISDRHSAAMSEVRHKVAPEIATIRSQVRAETRAIMNDAQKRRFDEYCARRDAQRALADR